MVAVSRSKRHWRVRGHRPAGNGWSSEERDLENSVAGWSLVAGADEGSHLRHRVRQGEGVCDLSRSRERKNRVAKRSAAHARGAFAEREWPGVAESRY